MKAAQLDNKGDAAFSKRIDPKDIGMRKKNSLVSYMYLIQIFDLRSSALSQPRSPKWLELLKFFERKKRKTTC